VKKVLIVTYAFPPSNDVAIHRVLRFGKWLPEYGWETVILTPEYTLSQRIDTDNLQFVDKYFKKVYRTSTGFERLITRIADKKNRNPGARFLRGYYINKLTPDTAVLWKRSAVKKGMEVIELENIDAIWATIGPLTSGLIGAELKKRTGIPLLIDYRDPWTLNPYKKLSGRKLETHRRLELSMLSQADTVVTTSDYIRDVLIENNYVDSNNVTVITNGYDPELQYINDSTETVNLDPSKIHITYTGGFYGDRQPYSFLDGLKLFFDEHPEYRGKIQFNIVGNLDPENKIVNYCKRYNFEGLVNTTGLVPYRSAMQYLKESDILLLVNGENDGSGIFIPGKLFDYMATKKPIIFIGEGQSKDIINELRLGETAIHDPETISAVIKKTLERNSDDNYTKTKFENFRSKFLANKLSSVLNSIKI